MDVLVLRRREPEPLGRGDGDLASDDDPALLDLVAALEGEDARRGPTRREGRSGNSTRFISSRPFA